MRQLQFALFVQLGMNVIIIVIISSEPLAMAVLVKQPHRPTLQLCNGK
jgi:hypothetical protein